jgi:tRNA-splicing ligase RtcB
VNKLDVWGADGIEASTIAQAERTSRLPFVQRVALMPDAHIGIGATVGSVVGTRNAIIPAAVGVDIGCGMAAVRFDMTADDLPDDLDRFMPHVEAAIPAGVGQGHDEIAPEARAWWAANSGRFSTEIDRKLASRALEQFGSLGSGNHFYEVCLDERDTVWFVLHSGSRGLGNQVGTRYIKTARELRAEVKLEDKDLAWLDEGSDEFGMYVGDMLACQDYARANRDQMLRNVVAAWYRFLGREVPRTLTVNCHHNFAEIEDFGDGPVWVTRKGAIKAYEGELGIIPGSMGTRSYIVAGKGNKASYCSCSHGAGRRLSRAQAKRQHNARELAALMKGKVWNADRAAALVDEIPHAYKDIDDVMAAQADLVEPLHTLRQILNFKGQ